MRKAQQIYITSILNKRDLLEKSNLINDFFDLYIDEANFPDEGEREDPEKIKDRIREMPVKPTTEEILANHPDPFTHLLCLEIENSSNKREFAAGCIVEYYPISGCVLITYIFVDPHYRGEKFIHNSIEKGLAEILLTDEELGLPALIKYFNESYACETIEGGIVKAVFFESNNPLLTVKDSMPPYKRLKFFKNLEAKRVDFHYVQPPIGTGQPPIENLLLLTFPRFNATGPMFIPVLTIMEFIIELAKSLDKNQELESNKYGISNFNKDIDTLNDINKNIKKDYARHKAIDMSRYIEPINSSNKKYTLLGYPNQSKENNILQDMFTDLLSNSYPGTDLIYLSEIPRTEEPNFTFKRASISINVLVDEDYFEVDSYSLSEENGHWVKPDSIKYNGIYTKRKDPNKKTKFSKSELSYCPICHSYETDLLSYHNQFNAPFFTSSFLFDSYVIVRFPASLMFTSEGRKETMYIKQSFKKNSEYNYQCEALQEFQYLPLHLAISYTYFDHSNIRVWNLSLAASEEFPVDEFSIIKLAKFFTGSQENKSIYDKQGLLLNNIGFAVCDYKHAKKVKDNLAAKDINLNFSPLTETFFGSNSQIGVNYSVSTNGKKRLQNFVNNFSFYDDVVSYKNIKTGTIQVDLSDGFVDITAKDNRYGNSWRDYLTELFNDLYLTIKPDLTIQDKFDLSDSIKPIPEQQLFLKDASNMLCGTTLGIFDFDRMGFEEIDDTLTPRPDSAKKYSFLTINRGALTSYHVEQDSVLDSAWNTLRASPYLLIPNALLTHNEYVLLDASEQLDALLLDLHTQKKALSTSPGIFIKRRNTINDLLNLNYLSNVFNYKTEKDLYEYGSLHRGITYGLQDAQAKLDQVDTMIEQLKNVRDNSYQRIIEILGFIISLTSVFSTLKDFFLMSSGEKNEVDALTITLKIFIPFLIISVIVFYRIKSAKPIFSLGTGNYLTEDEK